MIDVRPVKLKSETVLQIAERTRTQEFHRNLPDTEAIEATPLQKATSQIRLFTDKLKEWEDQALIASPSAGFVTEGFSTKINAWSSAADAKEDGRQHWAKDQVIHTMFQTLASQLQSPNMEGLLEVFF